MKKQVSAKVPLAFGEFMFVAYADDSEDEMPHLALIHPQCDMSAPVMLRVHSECLTGDLFGSKKCDCGDQLYQAVKLINQHRGVLIYLRQEGRGIGLINKLKAYNLQEQGLNTIDANHQLGFNADERSYKIATMILNDLGIGKVRILTNNPLKVESLQNDGIQIVERIPLQSAPHEKNQKYLKTKKDLMGHLFDWS